MAEIKKVFVVHKTHLDIGFTDLAETVMDTYLNTFIPRAMETAKVCNQGTVGGIGGEKKFVWTVGSYLIRYFLDHSPRARELREAIGRGDIVWHGLAVTTHTELMDENVLAYNLSLSKELDQEFGRTTVAAKMTDVPGHTAALVPALVDHGITYLHLGCNGSSRVLDIPPLSRLRYGDKEVIVHYAGVYGAADSCGEYALEFAHTSDNMGPPTPEDVISEMERLQKKYPQAQIVSGTMDDFARAIAPYAKDFPVVDAEPGDTWIHGVGGDPWKVGAYCEVLKAAECWKRADPQAVQSPAWKQVMEHCMLVCEHTWGCDSKRWLSDFKNWEKEAFRRAKQKDHPTEEDLRPAGQLITDYLINQETKDLTSYGKMEESWNEQRAYVEHAILALPEPYQSQAREAAAGLRPVQPQGIAGEGATVGEEISLAGYRVRVQPNGDLAVLATPKGPCQYVLGSFRYHVYSAKDTEDCFQAYNRHSPETEMWAKPDFAKPGLEHVEELESQAYLGEVTTVTVGGTQLQLTLVLPEEAHGRFGAPKTVVMTYTFGEQIFLCMEWFDKDASRIPEGLFLGFQGKGIEAKDVRVKKLGLPVDPYHICPGGNTRLHGVMGLTYGGMTVENHHAPVLSIGGAHLYDVEECYGDPEEGMYFLLFNNRWGTNFPLWYGENARFDFTVTL